jgi:hypothetical protein
VLLEIGHVRGSSSVFGNQCRPSGDDGKADQRRLDGKAASNHEEDASHNSARRIYIVAIRFSQVCKILICNALPAYAACRHQRLV